MNYKLSKHAVDVLNSRNIEIDWIDYVLNNPSAKVIKKSNEVNYFALIIENENRCLKVVLNPISMIVVTAYFDRDMRKKGCR